MKRLISAANDVVQFYTSSVLTKQAGLLSTGPAMHTLFQFHNTMFISTQMIHSFRCHVTQRVLEMKTGPEI